MNCRFFVAIKDATSAMVLRIIELKMLQYEKIEQCEQKGSAMPD